MSENQYINREFSATPTLAKKFILPRPILIDPRISGTKHKLQIGGPEFFLHIPRLKAGNGDFVFCAPKICKHISEYSGIPRKTWDEFGGDGRAAWGKTISTRQNDQTPDVYLNSVMITTSKLSKRVRLSSNRVKIIHDRLIHWYTVFAKWVELTIYQDLDYLLDSGMDTVYGVSTGSWVNIANNGILVQHASIKLSRHKPYKPVQLNLKMLRSFVRKANNKEEVSLADSILIDARRKLYRQDYNGSCLHFCQYIEASFREQIQSYFEKQGVKENIISRFLERRLLSDLIHDSKKFRLTMHITNTEAEDLVSLRNRLVHVRYNADANDVVLPKRVADNIFISR